MVMEAYPRGCDPCRQHWRPDHDPGNGAGQACRGQAHRGEVNQNERQTKNMNSNAQNKAGLEQSKAGIERLSSKTQPKRAGATLTATDWETVRKGTEKLFGKKA
jgi:hypothetical protein